MKLRSIPLLVALALAASSCSLMGGEEQAHRSTATSKDVVLVTHESFHLPKKLVAQFEQQSGYHLTVRASGDAGTLTSELALNADHPLGDVAFGVDNTFAQRALDAGVFADSGADLPPGAADYALPGDDGTLVPIDNGNVCVNVDTTWFEEHHQAPPQTMDDLADPAYRDLFVTSSPVSSSPGMAFLLATIAKYGDGWQGYWRRLLANGTKVDEGWEDSYYTDFTQGGEHGQRPIVLSYDSSPAYTVPKGSDTSTTKALLDTCFRQVEYAGVLAGADNPAGARALVEFLLSEEVQRALPESMYVFPVRDGTPLPPTWARFAQQPDHPWSVDAADIAAHRDQWLEQWRDLAS